LSGAFLTALCVSLLGCGAGVSSSSGPLSGGALRGGVHGGQQPIVGATIQLYAAGTAGYASSATPLLTSAVTTDATGSFSITGDYTCPSSTSQVYLVATGGNPGLAPGTNNAAIALMAALGPCSLHGSQYTLDPNSFITINEVTTVASVYALAAFMGGDAAHVGTSSTNAVGLVNAFQMVTNLVNTTTGAALSVTPAGNGTPPQAAINTLGNIVVSCVNSTGTTGPCIALAAAATPSGGTAPTDTIQGILNVARNPANNVSALFALSSPTPPFQPTLSTAPNDWILAVTYATGGSFPTHIALDASGNAWMTSSSVNGAPDSVTELNSNGAILSGANGYSIGNLTNPSGIAIDPTGNVWVSGTGAVVKLSSNGTLLSGTNGFTGGGLTTPFGIALDGQGNAWVSDSGSKTLIKLDSGGNILSGASGFTTGSTFSPMGVAIDRSGDAWVVDGSNLAEFNNSGAVLSGSGYPTGLTSTLVAFDVTGDAWVSAALCCTPGQPQLGFTNVAKVSSSGMQISPPGGYPNCTSINRPPPAPSTLCIGWNPNPFAVDGAGNVWGEAVWENLFRGQSQSISLAISELSNTGTNLSGSNGLTGGANWILSSFSHSSPGFLAIDGGGNVWVISGGGALEFIGAATPVVTPFSVGVKNRTLGARP
jgi:streptogramin lyase